MGIVGSARAAPAVEFGPVVVFEPVDAVQGVLQVGMASAA
ncbi:hypothetical protein [Alloactinosynnema sp. L-07]|nr:hypothetical protein [Alloactinosynnema sp. L-07]